MASFAEIETIKDLIAYLDDKERLNNRDYLYHYTTIQNAIAIFKSKTWHLGNPRNMNDMVEYNNGDSKRWENIFFASFMTENKESIAMWSMYSQPWKDGVKITIPKAIMKIWVDNINEILEVSSKDHKVTKRSIPVNEKNIVHLSSVAYSNIVDGDSENKSRTLTWSNKTNTQILDITCSSELTGYIKDSAWDYEKEIRLKAEFENTFGFERVAVRVPDNVLDKMIISSGPLFEGDLSRRIAYEIKRDIQMGKSFFTKKLNIKPICDDCQYKK